MPAETPHGPGADVRELLARDVDVEEYAAVRELWKRHSIAEDRRDLDGLVATLTPDCVYEIVGTDQRWEGHEGAAAFYTAFLAAFPDVRFELTRIVIGPQGVCEEADVTATHEGDFAGQRGTGRRERWKVVIFFGWDRDARLFTGERIWVQWPTSEQPGGGEST